MPLGLEMNTVNAGWKWISELGLHIYFWWNIVVLLKAISFEFLRAARLSGTKSWEFVSRVKSSIFEGFLKTYFENRSNLLGLFYVTVVLSAKNEEASFYKQRRAEAAILHSDSIGPGQRLSNVELTHILYTFTFILNSSISTCLNSFMSKSLKVNLTKK